VYKSQNAFYNFSLHNWS